MNLVGQGRFARTGPIFGLVVLYFVGLALNIIPHLPNIDEINYWDEIVYINSGKDLYDHGGLWPYSRGPVIAFIYAVIYHFIPDSEYWLLTAENAGRVSAYTLLLLSAWLVGRELERRDLMPALLLVALFTALPFYIILLRNPSYWIFTSFVNLTLWLALVYARTQKLPALVGASVTAGLCLMARPDIVFGASALAAMVIVTRPWRSLRMALVVVLMAGVPATFVGGYIFASGQQTGVYEFGGGSKLYDTFASSYQVLFDDAELAGLRDFEIAAKAREESARAFGTREENGVSTLRAIARNPTVFAWMVWQNTVKHTLPSLRQIFGLRVTADGKQFVENPLRYFALVILFFASLGFIELIRRREWPMLLILAVWPADLALYLLTTSHPDYFPFHFLIVLLLAAVGIWAGLERLGRRRMLVLWAVVLSIVVLLDWDSGGRVFYLAVGGALLLAIAAGFRHALARHRIVAVSALTTGLLLLNLPATFRTEWQNPDNEFLAQARYLKQNYPPATPTLAHPGIAAVSAKMWWIHMWPDLTKIRSKEDFLAAMQLVGTPLIVLDPILRAHNIYQSSTSIDKYAGYYYSVGYRSKDGRFEVLLPKDHVKSKVIPLGN